MWYKTNDWTQYRAGTLTKAVKVEEKSSGSTDLWYKGVVFVNSSGQVSPSSWLTMRGELCLYGDPDAYRYVWHITSKIAGYNYGFEWSGSNLPQAVYRLYNGGLSAHHYTLDASENSSLIEYHDWTGEGVGFYAYLAS